MQTIHTVDELRAQLHAWRSGGERIALVPTMGNLHDGHIALIRRARQLAARVVATIFVNPLQFDRAEDLSAYPRTLEQDSDRLIMAGTDLLFAPSEIEVYPRGREGVTRVEVPGITTLLEGEHRPGHFVGVATVVCKLFNMVRPDLAVFGEKDFQQVRVIERMNDDLDMGVQIIVEPTVREGDGLAMSSRNGYLTREERARAPGLYQTLLEVSLRLQSGEQDQRGLERAAAERLSERGFRPEYVAIRRASDLNSPAADDTDLVILAAAWLGRARLIDNIPLKIPRLAGLPAGD
ncbi:MAG: pantoate--beta-alanine ligase [Chromatiales bacterium]|jgi:pantoate--beta-alanine ligase|nr:pantoate--beta-alanine ligase [Chromatiales bacterium]MDX9766755.1 pantoate--beta-alanine ligase [Ectothiorhodospiraceae bacterium]